jgi:hypothetical protein
VPTLRGAATASGRATCCACQPRAAARSTFVFVLSMPVALPVLPRIVRDETVRKTPDTVRTQNYFI